MNDINQILDQIALDEMSAKIRRYELKLDKLATWFERQAEISRQASIKSKDRFPSLAETQWHDYQNFRDTAKDIRLTINK